MAAMASTKPIRSAPTSLKTTVWQHFEFYEVKGRIDKTYTVCNVCGTQLKNFGSTTHLRNHLVPYHPELGQKQRPVTDASQRTIKQAVAQLQPNFERAKQITKSITSFIALDLRPYWVVENMGFQMMVFTLEPRYKIPSRPSVTQTYWRSTVKLKQNFWTPWWEQLGKKPCFSMRADT